MQVLPATFPDHASWSLQGSGGHPGRSVRAQTLAWRVALARGCGLAGRSGQGGREGEPKPWSGPGAERARCRADAPPRLGADQARGTAGRRARRLSAVSARRTAPVAPTRTRPGLGGPGVPRWPGEVTAAGARRLRRGLGSWMLRPTSSGCGRPCSAPAVPGALPAHTCPLRVGVWGWSPGRRGLAGEGGGHTRGIPGDVRGHVGGQSFRRLVRRQRGQLSPDSGVEDRDVLEPRTRPPAHSSLSTVWGISGPLQLVGQRKGLGKAEWDADGQPQALSLNPVAFLGGRCCWAATSLGAFTPGSGKKQYGLAGAFCMLTRLLPACLWPPVYLTGEGWNSQADSPGASAAWTQPGFYGSNMQGAGEDP
jgi:hypothetical protein